MAEKRTIKVQDITVGKMTTGPASLPLEIDEQGKITLLLGEILPDDADEEDIISSSEDISIIGPDGRTFYAFCNRFTYAFERKPESVTAVPKRSPLQFIYISDFTRSTASVADPPAVYIAHLGLEDAQGNRFGLSWSKSNDTHQLSIDSDSANRSEHLYPTTGRFRSFFPLSKGSFAVLEI